MTNRIDFIQNINDVSSETGFQFELVCNRCGRGYRSKFEPMIASGISGALNAASDIFGGIFGTAASIGEKVKDAAWEKAHDKAYQQASEELLDGFIQCPDCQSWVCKERCFNEAKGLCKECAPDLGVKMAKAQAEKSVEEVYAHAAMAEEDKHLDTATWRKGIKAACPACGKSLASDTKFCPDCGAKIISEDKCNGCGAKLQAGAKFCGACGQKA